MNRIISLLLAVVLAATAVVSVSVVASAEEVERKFVVDGVLDQWYRSDDWARENGCYFEFLDINNTSMLLLIKGNGASSGPQELPNLSEKVQVKVYSAYDDHYAYIYVDVMDPDIATYSFNQDGSQNPHTQYVENIDFYVDTDPGSCEGQFYVNCASINDADTHFRIFGHDGYVTDAAGTNADGKYTLAEESGTNPTAYFNDPQNVAYFQHKDDSGKLIGYGCEARFPLARYYGAAYDSVIYHVAVTNHATEADPTACAISIGKTWWLTYNTGATMYLEDVNPFLADQDIVAARYASKKIARLPETVTISDKDAVEAARKTYDALTDDQKALVPAETVAKLKAAEERIIELTVKPGDLNNDGKVNAADALMTLKAAVGKVTLTKDQITAADVNKDGKVNASDALAILKKSVGKPAGF